MALKWIGWYLFYPLTIRFNLIVIYLFKISINSAFVNYEVMEGYAGNVTQQAHGHAWKYAKGKVKYVFFSNIIWVLKIQTGLSNGKRNMEREPDYISDDHIGEDRNQHSTVLSKNRTLKLNQCDKGPCIV